MHGRVMVDLVGKRIRASVIRSMHRVALFPPPSAARPSPLNLAFALILQSILALSAVAEPIPVAVFAREDDLQSLKLAPDGQFVAAVAGQRHEGVAFLDIRNGNVTNVAMGVNLSVFDFEWVSPQRVVLFEELPRSERVLRGYTGDLYAAERDRTEIFTAYRTRDKDLRPHVALVSTLRRRDDAVVLISVHPKRSQLRQLPYYTPATSTVDPYLIEFDSRGANRTVEDVPLVGARLVADHQDQVRFAVGYDRQASLVAMRRTTTKDDWDTFALPGFRDNNISVQGFTADNRAVTFIAVREAESLNGLYSLDLTSKAIDKLYQHSKTDIAEAVTDLESGAVAGVLVHGARPEYHWLDERSTTAQLYQMLERRFSGQTVRITSTSEDGRKALLLVNSDTNPGDYYILDVPGGQANFMMAARKGMDPARMHAKQAVQILARDGVTLHGYVTRPAASQGPLPMVVLPHDGLPGTRDSWDFDAQVQLLASRGYAVLQVNFRGSGGHGADFEAAGHRQWGALMQDDITDATRWAIEQGIAAGGRVCIYGVGYGGYAALMAVAREPTLYRCAAGYSGIYDLNLVIRTENLGDYRRGTSRYSDLFFGRDKALLSQQSPINNAGRIQTPVLLIHGKRDRRADLKQALRMKSALQRSNKSVELVVLDHSGPDAEQHARTEGYEKLLEFLEQHLSAPPVLQPKSARVTAYR